MVIELDLISDKSESSSHILLGEERPYSLVSLLTSFNDDFFFGANLSDNYNTPCSCNRRSCFRASSWVKTWVLLIEVTNAPLSLLLVDLRLENIL